MCHDLSTAAVRQIRTPLEQQLSAALVVHSFAVRRTLLTVDGNQWFAASSYGSAARASAPSFAHAAAFRSRLPRAGSRTQTRGVRIRHPMPAHATLINAVSNRRRLRHPELRIAKHPASTTLEFRADRGAASHQATQPELAQFGKGRVRHSRMCSTLGHRRVLLFGDRHSP